MPPLNRSLMLTTARSRWRALTASATSAQNVQSADVADFIGPLCDAICGAHDQWRRQAFFRGILINGPIATGGQLDGPTLEPLIGTAAPRSGPREWGARYASAVAGAVSEAWRTFQQSVTVPGLTWYPVFAAFPGPVAPPTPNIPTMLDSCTMNRAPLAAMTLAAAMKRRLGSPGPFSTELFSAIAEGFEQAVTAWISTQPITNVLGKGPVPTFAPPSVPAGPVTGGDTMPTPGQLGT